MTAYGVANLRLMLQGRRPYLVIILIFLAIAVVTVYKILNSPTHIEYYRLADDQSLMLGVTSGPGADAHLSGLVETADTVTATVVVVYFSAPLPQTGVGIPYEVAAHLAQPLGTRIVIDGSNGQMLERIPCAPPFFASPCPEPTATLFTDR